ncbi:hypothetical protein QV13_26935 [Mesorhizobium hungaricum]|uniref:Uncharacterized protein n=1 Tax=Mesorhizobium hungaricum TaxID=1566387 RepID=A0A1C2DEX2_9HYPH|nr:hypothetical protein QV13_26935 [Mesorhizobium hungaricum]
MIADAAHIRDVDAERFDLQADIVNQATNGRAVKVDGRLQLANGVDAGCIVVEDFDQGKLGRA